MTVLATFARICVADLDTGLRALAACGIDDVRLRFDHGSGLQLALVGDVLLLAGPDDVIDPFRPTDLTVIVDDLDEAMRNAVQAGARTVHPVATQPVGRNATVAFGSAPQVEYVEWNDETRGRVLGSA